MNIHEQQAQEALSSRHVFCRLMVRAREFGYPGWWDGKSLNNHPVGIVRGTIKMTNYWHADGHCSIQITDGSGWDTSHISHNPNSPEPPYPPPIGGEALTVWDSGQWQGEQYRELLEGRMLEILADLAQHIAEAEQTRDEQATEGDDEEQARRENEAAAIEKALA